VRIFHALSHTGIAEHWSEDCLATPKNKLLEHFVLLQSVFVVSLVMIGIRSY